MRCRFLGHALIVSLLLLLALPAFAGEPAAPDQAAIDRAVERGLDALVKLQDDDGRFGTDGTGITGLCGMALLSGGHTPTRGKHQAASAKALRSVIARQDRTTGYLGADGGNMYGHGFAALYLAEAYGMAPEAPVRRAVEAAIDLIHRSQNQEGGWRYQPLPVDADISVTVCQVMALRAAFNVGIGGKESEQAIVRAIGYIRRCSNGDGSFSYVANSGGGRGGGDGPEGVPRAAAGVMSLIGAGKTDDPIVAQALRFLRRHFATHLAGGHYFWYGQYYTAQALFHSPDPTDWERYWNTAAPQLVRKQNGDGTWNANEGAGTAYGTAMALIILQIPNNYLPIFQR